MSTVKAIRDALVTALDGIAIDGHPVKVWDHVPETLVAPCVVIQPGEPFLTDQDQPFNTYKCNWLVSLIADNASNARATEQLDALIDAAIAEVPATDVSAPYPFTYQNATYLAANLSVSDDYKIGD